MKTIYLDPITFTCHAAQNSDGTYIPHETDFFDGKCDTFLEGYRFVPEGHSWTREDGAIFHGEMISPFSPYAQLAAAQDQYEADMATLQSAFEKGVNSI